jgi:ABC-type antimicrobial peptide transport system permease subunit
MLIGVAAALAVSTLLETQLYGVQPHDPATYGASLAVLVASVTLACFIPARRATAVSPMEALRLE